MVTHPSTNITGVVTYLISNTSFQDMNGDNCEDLSTLVYVKDPAAFVKKVVSARKVSRPFLSLGLDGGQEKLILVLQVHDLDESADPAVFKEGGRRRSIILARGMGGICFNILTMMICQEIIAPRQGTISS